MRAAAQKLRRNMTKEERRLWYDFLKTQTKPFHRQHILGRYIVDFYCAQANLVIELDGSQHYEPEEAAYDAQRTRYLNGRGIEVLRFTNAEINTQFSSVCEAIRQKLL